MLLAGRNVEGAAQSNAAFAIDFSGRSLSRLSASGACGTYSMMTATPETEIREGLPPLLPRLWRFGVVLSGDRDMASELVQATCLRALEKSRQYAPGTRLDRWTFAIMASLWKNELRRAGVRRGHGVLDAETALAGDDRARLETTISATQVLSAAVRLPEAQRTALFLVYAEGCTYREAADTLEIPIGTLMSRLAAAKSALSDVVRASDGQENRGGGDD